MPAPDALHDELVELLAAAGAAADEATRHVQGCAKCQADAARLRPTLAVLQAEPPSQPVSPAVLDAVKAGAANVERLSYFADRVGELYDLSREDALALLLRAADDAAWEEGPAEGLKVLPVNGGPKVSGHIAALVKVPVGLEFPHHEHLGDERVLVLEGGFEDSGGVVCWRGEEQRMARGSEHHFVSIGKVSCICAALNALS